MYKVLITTSGLGSRLGNITVKNNKSLVSLGDKLVIDYVINSYKESVELVITIGHFGNEVKKYLENNYPKRNITFVDVYPFKGKGSSLGYSMLQAKKELMCPFVFHCNDTIVFENIPSPEEENWDGISGGNDPKIFNALSYSSVNLFRNFVKSINPKGNFASDKYHIGLVGIKDYVPFWERLNWHYQNNPFDKMLNDCVPINDLLAKSVPFKGVIFKSWLDVGNVHTLKNARSILKNR